MSPHPSEVFLSHSSLDRSVANGVNDLLRRHGVPVWYSPSEMRGAQQWHDEIGHALRRCDWFVVLLSPNSVQSVWIKRELMYALRANRYEERIVPVLIEPCDYDQLSWTLSSLQLVNLFSDFENGCRDLLRIWGIGYQPINPVTN